MDSEKTVWSMDEARLKILNEMMVAFSISLTAKDIRKTDSYGRQFWRDACALLDEPNFKKMQKQMQVWEEIKRKINPNLSKIEYDKAVLGYFAKANEIYVELNKHLCQRGLFFRQGGRPEDDR